MDYFGKNWQAVLKHNHLSSFDALWTVKTNWFEEPNIRRGGWSGVVKIPLKMDGNPVFIFLKRQENHLSKTWQHPISGIPTFQKEYTNLRRFHRLKIPTQELIYYGSRVYDGNIQAALITKDLSGYFPLDKLLPDDKVGLVQSWQHRRLLLSAVAKVIHKMHQHHIQHNSLYPKHIFAKPLDTVWDVKLIDLEKAKRRVFKNTAILRDLDTLRRHTANWTNKEQVYFFKAYVNESKLSPKSKKLWYKIQARTLSKSK